MRRHGTFAVLLTSLCVAGCQTPEGTPNRTATGALTGAAIGAGSGAIIGGASGHHAGEGALVGGAIGAVTGGIIGNAMDQQQREMLSRQSPETLQRIELGHPLGLADIKALVRAGLSDEVIMSQICISHTMYRLTTAEIIDLKDSGVSQRLINFMINTESTPCPSASPVAIPIPPPPPVTAESSSKTIFLFTPCVNGLQVNINGGVYPSSGASPTNLVWNWGDGQQTNAPFVITHTYPYAGNYTIQVTAYYGDGNIASASQTASVGPGVLTGCTPWTISAGSGGSVSYQASVGCGTVPPRGSVILQQAFEVGGFLTANPNPSYSFSGWSPSSGISGLPNGTAVDTHSASIGIIINSNSQILANFSLTQTDGHDSEQPPLMPTMQDGSLADSFPIDTSLSTALWTTDSELLRAIGVRSSDIPCRFLPPVLSFGPSGMQMSGVNGTYQFTGIQTLAAIAPPFKLTTTVMGTVAHGNAFGLYVVSGDVKQYLSIEGNVNRANGSYYGISIRAGDRTSRLYDDPDMNVPYTIQVAMGKDGSAAISLLDSSGTTLASRTEVYAGTGPFYVVLGQREGAPYTIGPNVAIWHSVKVQSAGGGR